jgi:uncharacterized protein DUF2799
MRTSIAFLAFAVASLTLAGCAGMDAQACASADWYDLGFRDALFGMQRQDDVYAMQCGRTGGQVDRARYAQGWREGVWEFDQRKAHGGEM